MQKHRFFKFILLITIIFVIGLLMSSNFILADDYEYSSDDISIVCLVVPFVLPFLVLAPMIAMQKTMNKITTTKHYMQEIKILESTDTYQKTIITEDSSSHITKITDPKLNPNNVVQSINTVLNGMKGD